jgi:hypothetical protein
VCVRVLFETGCYYVAQAGLEFTTILPQAPKCACMYILNLSIYLSI